MENATEKMSEILYLMASALHQQVKENDYRALHTLWDYAKCKNNMIHPRKRDLWNMSTSPTDALMSDVVDAVCERAKENTTVIDEFYRIMTIRYPDAVEECTDLKALSDSNKINELDAKMDVYWQHADMPDMDISGGVLSTVGIQALDRCTISSKCIYYAFLVEYLGVNVRKAESGASTCALIRMLMLGNGLTAADNINYDYVFDDEENVFSSIEFRQYVDRRREALADYLRVEYSLDVGADNLECYLHIILKSHANTYYTPVIMHPDDIVRQSAIETLVAHNGAAAWYNTLAATETTGYPGARGYRPVIEDIIERFCKSYLQVEIAKHEAKGKRKITKTELFTCLPVPDPREMFLHIAYLYNMEIVCKLMDDINAERYRNFSWEWFTTEM